MTVNTESTSTGTTNTFPTTAEIAADVAGALQRTGVDLDAITGDTEVHTPITGEVIFRVRTDSGDGIDAALTGAAEAFATWREVPAPVRGQLVKRISAATASSVKLRSMGPA
jgi:aldehyde dehydrogenase (NAD+)